MTRTPSDDRNDNLMPLFTTIGVFFAVVFSLDPFVSIFRQNDQVLAIVSNIRLATMCSVLLLLPERSRDWIAKQYDFVPFLYPISFLAIAFLSAICIHAGYTYTPPLSKSYHSKAWHTETHSKNVVLVMDDAGMNKSFRIPSLELRLAVTKAVPTNNPVEVRVFVGDGGMAYLRVGEEVLLEESKASSDRKLDFFVRGIVFTCVAVGLAAMLIYWRSREIKSVRSDQKGRG